jgi:tetratricopeptide (TPR) repeat protein
MSSAGKLRAVLLALALLVAMPAVAQTPTPLQISRNEAVVDFPETITFYLGAESSAPVEKAEVEYGVERQACGVASSRVPADLEPGTAIRASWVWKMRTAGPLPPGSRVWWRWRLTREDGSEERTEREWLTFADDNHEWQTLTEHNITIAWYEGDEEFGRDLVQAGWEGLERFAAQPEDVLQEPVQVFVYRDSNDLKEAIIFSPDWIGGRAYVSYGIILMAVSPRDLEWGQETLRHELSHLVVYQLTFNCWGNSVPTWLEEGLATYAEGDQPADEARVEQAADEDELLTLRILSGSFSADSEEAHLSYAQSYHVVRYLIDTHGRDKVLEVLAQLGEGAPVDDVLLEIYGFDTDGLEAEWRSSIGAQVRATATPTAGAVAGEDEATPAATPTPSPTPAATPTPFPSSLDLRAGPPPADLLAAGLVPAPDSVGDGPARAPLVLLILGCALLAGAVLCAVLAWRRRLPVWVIPLPLVLGGLLLAGHALSSRSAVAYNEGLAAFRLGRFEDAEAAFGRALAVRPGFLRVNVAGALANRGAAALNLGDSAAARADLEAGVDGFGPSPDEGGDPALNLARTYLARWHLLNGDASDALPPLDAALEGQADLASALAARAEANWQMGDLAAASRDATAALEAGFEGGDLARRQVLAAAHAVRGAVHLLGGETEAALADAAAALGENAAQPMAYAVRGGVWLRQGEIEDAYADAETALALEADAPTSGVGPLALTVRAGARLAAGQTSLAAADAQEAHQAAPWLAWAHALHAAAAWQLGDLEAAAAQSEAALALDPGAPLALAAPAGIALAEHRLEDALAAAEEALAADAGDGQGLLLAVRAAVHLLSHRPQQALADAAEAQRLQPFLALGYAAGAAAGVDLVASTGPEAADLEAALEAAERAVALDPSLALGFAARAGARLLQSQVMDGLADAEQAVELDPDLAPAHLWLGVAHLRLGRLEMAESDLEAALALDPGLALAQAYRSMLALSQEDAEEALALAEEALVQDPALVLGLTTHASALVWMGDLDAAGEVVEQALTAARTWPEPYVARALLYLRQGSVDEALADLDTALSHDPRYTTARTARAWVLLRQGDYDQALADADRAVGDLPSVETYVARAEIESFLGRYEDGLADLEEAEALAPESALPPVARVYLLEATHDPEEAEAQAIEALARQPESALAHLTQGWLHGERRAYEAALESCDRALELAPWSLQGLILRARIRQRMGETEGGLEDAEQAVALAPGSAAAREVRGLLRVATDDAGRAIRDLLLAVDYAPGNPWFQLSLANARLQRHQPDEAQKAVEEALGLLPEHALLQTNAAVLWIALDDAEGAIETCDRALELDPDLAAAYVVRGQAYLALDDASQAIQDFSRALQLDRTHPEARALRGRAYLWQGKLERALDEAQEAVELDDYSATAQLVLCQAHHALAQYREALEPCDRAVELTPAEVHAFLTRGLAHTYLGQLDEALADLTQAAKLQPDWSEPYWHRATVHEELGDLEKAIRDLERTQERAVDADLKDAVEREIDRLEHTEVAVGGPASYTHPRFDFSLAYPEGWRLSYDPWGSPSVQVMGPFEEGYRPMVMLFVERPMAYGSLDELAAEVIRDLEWNTPGFELLESSEVQLGGEPALSYRCQADMEHEQKLTLWMVFAIHDRTAVVMTLVAHSERFSEVEPQFQEILDSFAFTD